MTEKPVIVRFPPSPTGLLHIGTVRTCLYNYLFAKKHGGKIVMRLEDTDTQRSTEEYADNIMSGLQNLGITWDDGPFKQSERGDIYKKHLQQLIDQEKAYFCFCTAEELEAERAEQQAKKLPPRYSGKCRSVRKAEADERMKNGEKAVIRFKVPEQKSIIFEDIVRGKVEINTREIADFVIAKDLKSCLYNFVVVVDDHEMNVSHVIRGEDHISNTPKQILIFEAFGWQSPQFAHLPLILNSDKSKLSKRKNDVSVDDYLQKGILPEALLNFLALLGWNTKDEKEIFTMDELTEHFELERVQKGGAIFDYERLLWMNGSWIRQLPVADVIERITPFLQNDEIIATQLNTVDTAFLTKAVATIHERLKTLAEAPELLRFYFVTNEEYTVDAELFPHQKMKVDLEMAKRSIGEGIAALENVSETDWTAAKIQVLLMNKVQELGIKNGQLLWPLRVALSNEKFSPGVFEILDVLGKAKSLARLHKAKEVLG
jgi:glutamyl-tRNA synthetase